MSIEGRYVELSLKRYFCLKCMAKWDLFPLSLLENVPIAERENPRKDCISRVLFLLGTQFSVRSRVSLIPM